MINRIILLLTLGISAAIIASEPNHIMLDETMSNYTNQACVANAQKLLQIAMRRVDVIHGQLTSDQLIHKFVQQNGTSASFSARDTNRMAGQEIVDQVLDKNFSAQTAQPSSIAKRIAQRINKKIRKAHRAKL